MRFKTFIFLLAATLSAITFFGCVERHIKAPKFDIYANTIPSFKGSGPVAVIVPEPTGERSTWLNMRPILIARRPAESMFTWTRCTRTPGN